MPTVWAFDMDGTLIGSIRSDVLRPGARELLTALGSHGIEVVIWSAGGAEYAERMASRHELEAMVGAHYGKEGRGEDGRFLTTHFADHHQPTTFVDDQPDDVPVGASLLRVPQFFGGNPADRALFTLLDGLRSAR